MCHSKSDVTETESVMSKLTYNMLYMLSLHTNFYIVVIHLIPSSISVSQIYVQYTQQLNCPDHWNSGRYCTLFKDPSQGLKQQHSCVMNAYSTFLHLCQSGDTSWPPLIFILFKLCRRMIYFYIDSECAPLNLQQYNVLITPLSVYCLFQWSRTLLL